MSFSYPRRSQFQRGNRSNFPRRSLPRTPKVNLSAYTQKATPPIQEDEYKSIHSFADFGFDPRLSQNIASHSYTQPTPIQDKAIPVLLQGNDVVGIANTGTGKTAAFVLPFIQKILLDPKQGVLILAPTRELALQICDEFSRFAYRLPLGVCLCIGGTNINSQIQRLKQNPHFVIGTPGRIKDLLMRGIFKTELFSNIILDEVDRMLDIGFRKDILFLISKLPIQRQAALFSATINRDVDEIMRGFLHNPITIELKKQETANHIQQDLIAIKPGENKVDILHNLLRQSEFEKVIVFGRTKHGINRLEQQLSERGIRVSAIHGNKTQGARQRSLQAFKFGRVQALLATDVAARGIDVENVTHVINYDEPETYDEYVHRIGRTGRAGKMGKALTFVSR